MVVACILIYMYEYQIKESIKIYSIMNTEKESGVQTYLSFSLSEEAFAINVSRVINILEMSPITKIPRSPEYMKGVINLRGTVLPVTDLRVKFGLPATKFTVDTSIIVVNIDLNGELVLVGIIVDNVKEVIELKTEEITLSPVIGSKYNSGFVEGMHRMNDKFIMLLNINKIFSIEEAIDFKEQIEQTTSEITN